MLGVKHPHVPASSGLQIFDHEANLRIGRIELHQFLSMYRRVAHAIPTRLRLCCCARTDRNCRPEEGTLWDRLCAKIAEDLTPEEMDRAAPSR